LRDVTLKEFEILVASGKITLREGVTIERVAAHLRYGTEAEEFRQDQKSSTVLDMSYLLFRRQGTYALGRWLDPEEKNKRPAYVGTVYTLSELEKIDPKHVSEAPLGDLIKLLMSPKCVAGKTLR